MCSARLVAALVIAGLAGARLDAQTLSAEDLARRIERRYDQVRDFSADFVHTYVAGVLRQRLVERGTVQVKRPGRMRWVYTSPEDKTYVPADRQVIVNPLPAEDEATTAVLFLAGKGRLTRDFSVRYAEGADAPAGTVALRLDPHRPERDYDWLVLVVDQRTLVLRRLVAADRQGGVSTFDFTRVKENVGLPDTLFVFTMPRGVDVIRPNPTAR
jgi:outer membrane lipoprotein carrier protein